MEGVSCMPKGLRQCEVFDCAQRDSFHISQNGAIMCEEA